MAASPSDPWENWNRKVYAFHDAIDEAVLKPVAEAYRKVLPELVRAGISNVFGNIADVWSAVNHLLQGKIHFGLDMGMRVAANTLFGLGGLLDPASEMGLKRRQEDFGETLGRWGVGPGPYLVLPLLARPRCATPAPWCWTVGPRPPPWPVTAMPAWASQRWKS